MIEAAAQSAWSTDRGAPIVAGVIAALRPAKIILPAPAVVKRTAICRAGDRRGIVTETGEARERWIGLGMALLSYRRHRFPPPIIQHAIWLYLRFTLSYRDVEELLAERGLEVSYETVRRWVLKFGATVAQRLRKRRPRPSDRWHLDEMVVRIAGRRMYLWRAVDHEAASRRRAALMTATSCAAANGSADGSEKT